MAQKKYTTAQKLDIIERVEKGESRNSVSKKTGISPLTIKNWISKKEKLLAAFCFESRNKKGSNKKKRYDDRIKNVVVARVEGGKSMYRVSRELGIPYLTIKNWVLVSQNKTEPKVEITLPDSEDVIISEEEKKELLSIMEENAKNETQEDTLLRHIEQQNREISDLRKQITALEDEISMLKISAILMSKKLPKEEID